MPVALLALAPAMGFAPIARPRFLIGSDLDCDLVDRSAGVAPFHARVRLLRGEYVLVAMEGCSLWIDGERVPLLTLCDGDRVAFSPEGALWQFRSRVEGSFWPPTYSVGEAWIRHPAFKDSDHTPAGVDWTDAATTAGADVEDAQGALRVMDLGVISDGRGANAHLRFLAALGGASHPGLAPVADGGVFPLGDEVHRWIAVRRTAASHSLDHLFLQGAVTPTRAIRIFRDLARMLAHLHQRGIVLRNLRAEAIRLGSQGEVLWDDYAHAYSLEGTELLPRELEAARTDSKGPPTTHEDIYQLGRIAGLVLQQGPVGQAADLRPPHTADMNEAETHALESVLPALLACLAEIPAHRPAAASLVLFLDRLLPDPPKTPLTP